MNVLDVLNCINKITQIKNQMSEYHVILQKFVVKPAPLRCLMSMCFAPIACVQRIVSAYLNTSCMLSN